MEQISTCSFKEFVNSGFACLNGDYDSKTGILTIANPGCKITVGTLYRGEVFSDLHSFYLRGPSGRWIKKMEISDEQALDDFEVQYFKGDESEGPGFIRFTNGNQKFDFYLTPSQIDTIDEAIYFGDSDYFPGI